MKLEKIADKVAFLDNTFTKRTLFNEEKILSFILNLKSGQEIPPHQHEKSDLVLHVLTGKGELTVDGEVSSITSGDVVYCEGKETFSLKSNTDENMSCFVVLAPRPSPSAYAKEIGNV
ncbi:cupin domain-containing protein [Clostridium sp. DJ247]|uniref:cupin domain-containing protein n=1 Tax=Clostridium sp. DJ247 TaxID=2726188 RepID=UPI001629A392|nr:cupin domain-containing protein [Clostridium sp. DJ247]MBC2579799.1 cupin domain-containing protein [Clostridium sp. DJ247]